MSNNSSYPQALSFDSCPQILSNQDSKSPPGEYILVLVCCVGAQHIPKPLH